eukprot:TRINITY_DN3552_c0_g1_i6.p1 TRINITY_DN3552_c0_g1~~TRINITY_DN3552_c0_g1_i6.p1  ORF type:complete len:948 (+),score=131.28 TRINITY_DN3552_c0_g1_i6:252-2846(+)
MPSITELFEADKIWKQGFKGQNVKMGIFDTGVRSDHPHVKNVKERSNWTHEPTLEDGLGHGTFVAGVISSQDATCPGLAPEVDIYTFRVFTNDQVSYTSWFLDAFNYAIATGMNVVNLSIGGPDYLDAPFVDKVFEITSNGILMVSAIGNDGPLYGTLNNPADQNDVIGVGGIDYNGGTERIAQFSSRGMSTWELPYGYGRSKPDVMAYGKDVRGSKIQGGCRTLSGTSVASPVVAGAVCLLASTVSEPERWRILNPASMKQVLIEGADRMKNLNVYEQGPGKMNVVKSHQILKDYKPRASANPSSLDFTDHPYMWPFSRQPFYAGAMPIMFNTTVLNGQGVVGRFEGEPRYFATNQMGRYLEFQFEYSDVLWPWSGYLASFITVKPNAENMEGIAEGEIQFTITSPPAPWDPTDAERKSFVKIPVKVWVIPTPPRNKRILWDQFHNVRYPPGYVPRDNLDIKNDILDWHGDHPHTNFHGLYDHLRDAGYFLEILASPFTCFDAENYGTLILADLEEEYYPQEIEKLEKDVKERGLGLVVFAEWYNVDTMIHMRFFDDNTRLWWTPITGGANVPALNDLLQPFGIAFGDSVPKGPVQVGTHKLQYSSGTHIVKFPEGGWLYRAQLAEHSTRSSSGGSEDNKFGILGLLNQGAGRISVYGDTSCLDSNHQTTACFGLLSQLVQWVAEGTGADDFTKPEFQLQEPVGNDEMLLPERRRDVNFTEFSEVLQKPIQCHRNSLAKFQELRPPNENNDVEMLLTNDSATTRVITSNQQTDEETPAIKHSPELSLTQIRMLYTERSVAFVIMVVVVFLLGALWKLSRRNQKQGMKRREDNDIILGNETVNQREISWNTRGPKYRGPSSVGL